ncbi:MAG: fumarylacetoacetate hydrolase family protein [Burkholderiales bacterium]|nr:fumarylacetoacetate hydrolase family protein [Burkholderiales bacterium]
MTFLSFEVHGRALYGCRDASGQIRQAPADFAARHADLKTVIAAGRLEELRQAALERGPVVEAAAVRMLPVIPNPGKVFCVGLNYKTHVAETKRADSEYPSIFVRFADSLAAHGDLLPRPAFSTRFDFEGELALIVGKGGRNIAESDALGAIAGYACFNDVSVRDWQRHTHQWTPGKNFPGTGPLGPALVARADAPDVNAMTLTTRLNGQVMQHADVADLIFTIPVIVAYLSRFTPLSPGDVIATGTPGGVGDRRDPPIYMKEGDVIEVEITGLGVLRNTVGLAA